MLRVIALAAGCLAFVAAPALAYEWKYDCKSGGDKGVDLHVAATFNSEDGGKLRDLSGELVVRDFKLDEKFVTKDVHQVWSSDRSFNVQINTDRSDWMAIVETVCDPKNDKKPCVGRFLVNSKKDKKSKEGRISCENAKK